MSLVKLPAEDAEGYARLIERHGAGTRPLFTTVGRWAIQVFGGPERVVPCVRHIRREVSEELMPEAERVASGQTNDLSKLADETADLVVLACGLAAHAGFDLSTALARKMLHNVNEREWQPADAEGVIEHVRA